MMRGHSGRGGSAMARGIGMRGRRLAASGLALELALGVGTALAAGGFVGGGVNNNATGTNAVAVGGDSNTASGLRAFIGAGFTNTASGTDAVAVGGFEN